MAPLGVELVHVIEGESPAIARDYARHHRSTLRHLVDPTLAASIAFQTGWPAYVLVDAEGTIRFQGVGLDEHRAELREALKSVAVPPHTDSPPEVICEGGICRLAVPTGAAPVVRESEPVLAAGADGSVWLAYSSDADGDSNVFLRRVDSGTDGAADGEARAVTRSLADDFAPSLAVAADGTVWVAWCSDEDGRYDVHVRSLHEGRWSKPERISASTDDAFAPALAIDGGNRPWVTWYEWNRDFGSSRDRDVFASHREAESWTAPLRVSPLEPKIEDHTDPAVIADPRDPEQVLIAWSYDYHPDLVSDPLDTDQPSIFARTVRRDGSMGEPLLVGTRGERSHVIDLWPSLARDGEGTLWCAWDATSLDHGRSPMVAAFDGEEFLTANRVAAPKHPCSPPALCIDPDGIQVVAWSERRDDHWRIRVASGSDGDFDDAVLPFESAGDQRAPVLAIDGEGHTFAAFEEQVGAEVRVRVLPFDL